MDRRLWWRRLVWRRLVGLLVLTNATMIYDVHAQTFTSFDFPTFTSTENLLINRDAEYMSNTSSVWLNPHYNGSTNGLFYSCGELIYAESVQMRSNHTSSSTPAVASFTTSFTFAMTGENSAGMAFMFAVENHTTGSVGASLCLLPKPQNGRATNHLFAVEFDTWKNPEFDDPSDNHVGVNINSMNSTAVYNYCGGTLPSCSPFFHTDQDFTAWIDYNSTTQTVLVFLTAGSLALNITKPATPIIEAPHIDLTDVFYDYMYVGLTGSGAMYPEVKKIKSWSFSTGSFGPGAVVPSTTTPSSKRSWVGLIAGVVSGAVTVAVLCGVYFLVKARRGGGTGDEGALSIFSSSERNDQMLCPRGFSFQELSAATNGFSKDCLLGEGGYGQVFKGRLRTGGYESLVAVKRTRIKEYNEPSSREFAAELSVISQIRHRNLVRLHGWCQEGKNLLLVFEYMPNGSLEKWLFDNRGESLAWQRRQGIMRGVAAALEYLHEGWNQCILHRDIKAANVLLDEEFNAHVGDFGLARLTSHSKMGRTTAVAGTFGYLAPETAQDGKVTQKSDVYSFGILALEVASGRPVLRMTSVDDEGEPVNLLECVWRAHERGELLGLVDPRLGSTHEDVKLMFQLGLLCCHPDPDARPVMRVVHRCMVDGEVGQLVASLPPSKPRVQYFVGGARQSARGAHESSRSHSKGAHSETSDRASSSGLTWSSSGSAKFLTP